MSLAQFVALIAILFSSPLFAASKASTQLRVAYSSISGSAVIPWIAVDKGIFAKYDLDVELIYVAGSPAMQSLLGGTTQLGIQGIEPVMRVNAQGSDAVMIVGLVTKPPFSIIVRPEIREPKDLKGRAMGITRFGSTTDALLRLALDKWGLRRDSHPRPSPYEGAALTAAPPSQMVGRPGNAPGSAG